MSTKLVEQKFSALAIQHGFMALPKRKNIFVCETQEIVSLIQLTKYGKRDGFYSLDASFSVDAKLDPADGVPPPVADAKRSLGKDADYLWGWRDAGSGTGIQKQLSPESSLLNVCWARLIMSAFSPKVPYTDPSEPVIASRLRARFSDEFLLSGPASAAWTLAFFDRYVFRLPVRLKSRQDIVSFRQDGMPKEFFVMCKREWLDWYCTGKWPPVSRLNTSNWEKIKDDQRAKSDAERAALYELPPKLK